MQKTNIEWTATNGEPGFTANPLKYRDAAGNVVWGCVKTSPGCNHCYAETLAHRYGRGGPFKQSVMDGLTPFLDEKELHKMLTYKPAAGKRCFVGDMTDMFGEWVPDELLDRLFAVFALRRAATWQVLTKRAERMRQYLSRVRDWSVYLYTLGYEISPKHHVNGVYPKWPLSNVWLGTSVEDQQRADERIPLLLQTPAAVRFLSVEPLLGPVQFDPAWLGSASLRAIRHMKATGFPAHVGSHAASTLPAHEYARNSDGTEHRGGIDWIIVGGESGHGARPMQTDWARSIVKQCRAAQVPVFVKQLGANIVDHNDAGFDGDTPTSWPAFDHEGYVEEDLDGTRDGYQGAPVRVHLNNRKGGDMEEWPEDLRVREFPVTPPH